ncbi:transcription factor Adf-1-like [Anthonomus grandis grandis]|uniref:transcription factor Adf-1-like n=1 Tax=Anthonomus grandis grandis TaxID=2921223 RepID=UPI00216629EB|nr:transcription factor Adf-1-like [Anthonomus grandis grandis]
MDIERLIEEVRKFPVLYDQKHGKYRNTEYKERVWKQIATDLQVKGGVEECKKKWTSVRDQLRKTLQKRKTSSGQAAVRQHKYKYEDLLMFLLPHIAERETISNVLYNPEGEEGEHESTLEESQDEDSNIQDFAQKNSGNEEPITENQDSETQSGITAQSSQMPPAGSSLSSNNKNKFVRPPLKRKFQHERHLQQSPSSQLMTYILAEKEAEKVANKRSREREEQHPVDAFLAGIAPALKSLHPILFNQAKGSIFSIVQEFELKQLTNNSSPSESVYSSDFASIFVANCSNARTFTCTIIV